MSQPPVERLTVNTDRLPGYRCTSCCGPVRLGADGLYYHTDVPEYLGTLVREVEPIPDDDTSDTVQLP